MSTVEIVYRFTGAPSESVSAALADARDIYGIRRISIDGGARTLRVEYDATRLNPAAVTKLIRLTGLDITEELPLVASPDKPTVAA
jgi:hypothetical protein